MPFRVAGSGRWVDLPQMPAGYDAPLRLLVWGTLFVVTLVAIPIVQMDLPSPRVSRFVRVPPR